MAQPKLEIRRDKIEVTSDGTLGIPPDTARRFVPGPNHYYIDDVEVTEAEFIAAQNDPDGNQASYSWPDNPRTALPRIKVRVGGIRCTCASEGWPMVQRPLGGVALFHENECLISKWVRDAD